MSNIGIGYLFTFLDRKSLRYTRVVDPEEGADIVTNYSCSIKDEEGIVDTLNTLTSKQKEAYKRKKAEAKRNNKI